MARENYIRLEEGAVEAARRISPEAFLRRHFRDVTVDRSGHSIRVDKYLRADFKKDCWVSCDWYGGGIGDNISLVRSVMPGATFVEAVTEITGNGRDVQRELAAPPPSAPSTGHPRLPFYSHAESGRAYLADRGISSETIRLAEDDGAIWYCRGGVLFLGRDRCLPGNAVRAATIRYFAPHMKDDGVWVTKRDLADSDKTFPMTISGDPDFVIVLEGGVNALAAVDLTVRDGRAAPTVVATGGVGVRNWVNTNDYLSVILRHAGTVEIWGENEVDRDGLPDPLKQEKTDVLRRRLAEDITRQRGGRVAEIIYPPPAAKDAADWNRDAPAPSGPAFSP